MSEKIIDFHNHLGEDKDGKKQMPEELIERTKDLIYRSVVFPFNEKNPGKNFSEANDRILVWTKKYKKLIGFFRINPNEKGFEDEIKRCVENGLKGMKLHPRSQNFSLKSKNVKKCLELVRRYEVPVIIHCGRTVDLDAFKKLAEEFSDVSLIIGHAGMDRPAETTKIAEKYKNVFLEISINTQDSVRFILEHTDINQILFGSDTPYGDPELTLKRINNIKLKKEERRYILYENAKNLLEG
ncbi:MAG: hypothetical protein B5M53_07430 [Candidatus Cloacimonas sp. 4484_209]|nr:MAG: hypothetical protein B5M53_07430 [Candidatus Cloacimonas sp. 4484_209]